MDSEVRRLARQIGVDMEDLMVARLLELERVVAEDAGVILQRTRHAMDHAYRSKRSGLQVQERDHGMRCTMLYR